MFSTKEQLEVTVDCLINKIWELNNLLRVSENKAKAFEEGLENFNKEKSKSRELEEKLLSLEIENSKLKKENKDLQEKIKTKKEVKEIMKNLSGV